MDPLAAEAPDWSTYRYAFDNPILFYDPDGRFETKKEAREHRRTTKGMGFLRGDVVRKQKDGSYAIENRSAHTSTYDLGEDFGIITAVDISNKDVMSIDLEGPEDGRLSEQHIVHIHRDGTSEVTNRAPITAVEAPPVGPGGAGKAVVKGYQYVKTIGKKYRVFQRTVKSKNLGGQARAVYTKVKNQTGKTVRFFKDAFKRDGRHYERANYKPTKTRSRKRD